MNWGQTSQVSSENIVDITDLIVQVSFYSGHGVLVYTLLTYLVTII